MCVCVCVCVCVCSCKELHAYVDFKERIDITFVINYDFFHLRSVHQLHSMAGSPRIVMATLLPFLVRFTNCSDHTTHYVKPAANTPCPADPCLTLSEYAQQTHHWLTSNTTLLFLPGDHALSVNFTVENVSDFGVYAQQTSSADARIVCQGLVGITFRYISRMTVHGLAFNSCGKGAVGHDYYTGDTYLTTYGVSVYLGQEIRILNCLFQDSIGTALGVFYSSLVLKGSNSFTNNCRGCAGRNCTCICLGGGIYAHTSTLIFEAENSTFISNSAEDGGGIYALQSTLNFSENSTFISNSAEYGGGIYALQSTLNFSENSTFISNSAKYGGGIYAWQSTLNFTGISTFRNNSADKFSGGGIMASDSSLKFTGNIVFQNNSVEESGGGIGAKYSTLRFTGSTAFGKNSAKKFGGGITVMYSTLNFTGNTTFRNNLVDTSSGGYWSSDSSLKFISNTTFQSNSVEESGGGIVASDSSLKFTGNTTFQSNSAEESGGGIVASDSSLKFTGNTTFQSNSAEESGGGIVALDSSLKFTGNTTFQSNSAEESGGGIVASNSSLKFTGNTTFQSNSAEESGGGISALDSSLNFSGDTTFQTNSAEESGGGIVALGSNLKCTGNTNLQSNSAGESGGGIVTSDSSLNFSGNTTFQNNSAEESGGGILASDISLKFTGNTTFQSNSAEENGGGIIASNRNVKFTGNTIFQSNSAGESGGGIIVTDSSLNFTGNTTFQSNSAEESGGGISASDSSLKFTGKTTFQSNSAEVYGGGIITSDSNCKFIGNTIFQSNSAEVNFTGNTTFKQNSADSNDGGGIFALNSTLNFTGNTTFRNISAKQAGGGIWAFYSTLNFTGNTTFRSNLAILGGGIYTRKCILDVTENSRGNITGKDRGDNNSFTLVFMDNSALIHGGAVYTKDSILHFEGHNTFSGNSARYYGGGIYSENSTLKFSGNTSFGSNSGQVQGGGIYGLAASIYFSGNNSFTANTAARGGGEYLVDSFNFLIHNTVITMDSNNATEYGGAVYVEDSNPFSYCFPLSYKLVGCFFQIYGAIELPPFELLPSLAAFTAAIRASLNIHSLFYNNNAGISGSAIYGGSIDNCIVHIEYSDSGRYTLFDPFIDVLNMELQQEPNSISSDPLQVCMCEDGIANCSTLEFIGQVYPGEQFHFPVVATGQRDGVVPAVVRAFFADSDGNTSLAQFQDTQNVKADCTVLHYQLCSSAVNKTAMLVLYADGPCGTDGIVLNISFHFLPCPPGFSLNSSEMICGCEPRLQKYTTRCNITERTLTGEGEFWAGYDNYSQTLILHPHCPFDYCKPATDRISFPLSNSDLQCENSRSGLLCGECQFGFSLALGSSKCIQCSNLHILLLLPFAMAGITLVLFLLICKPTVAAGTINGLIFYANIVAANRAIFLPHNQTNILTVFIAWLNLDLGIETCFYDGMDAYAKTWLQFIFPLYIWSLVGLIIIVSYYSSRIGRLFGSNPVAVLATLFLLSYVKLLRTIIASLFVTFLDYPNDVQVAVWLHDGNIRYLHGKHIALFLVALLTLLILFLPYTLLLTVGQWLQAKSTRRCLYWINNPRIKPFLDAYHAPYRDQHRYWTGMMLCLRCTMLLVFAFNTHADPSLNLLVIGTAVIGLLTLTHFTGFIYKKLYLDILEISFILNLGILAVATYYVKFALVPVSQAAVVYTSVGTAFATFIGVLLYHTCQHIWPKFQQKINQLRLSQSRVMYNDNSSEDEADVYHEAHTLTAPTMTIIERPHPETLDLNDNTSMKALHMSIAPSSNVIEFRDQLDLINPANSKSQPLIPPTTNFTELREPLELINTNNP